MTDLLIILVISISFFIQSAIGFGGGIISIPILAIILDPLTAITLILLFQIVQGSQAVFNYKQLDKALYLKLLPALAIASIIGALIAIYVNEQFLSIFLAVFILLYVVYSRFKLKLSFIAKLPASIAGALSGIVHGITGTGAPILVIYLKEMLSDRLIFRATLMAIFVSVNIVRLVVSLYMGIIDSEILIIFLKTLPVFLISIYMAQKFHKKISEKLFMNVIDVLLIASAATLLFRVIL